MTQSGYKKKFQRMCIIPDDQGINSVSRCSRNVTNNGSISAQQSVEQTGFPHIWSTDEGDVRGIFFEHFCYLLHVRCGDLIYRMCMMERGVFVRGKVENG